MQLLHSHDINTHLARVRSGLHWLKEGHANTAYFHHHARHRKRKTSLEN
jgi:hypothetical protein